jgi:hypothetical protein
MCVLTSYSLLKSVNERSSTKWKISEIVIGFEVEVALGMKQIDLNCAGKCCSYAESMSREMIGA